MSSGDSGVVLAVLSSLSFQAPLFLAWIVGIVVAVVTWRKHPSVSLLITIALGMLLVVGVIGGVLQAVLPFTLSEQGASSQQVGAAFSVLGAVRILIDTVAWALLLVALFRRRDGEHPSST